MLQTITTTKAPAMPFGVFPQTGTVDQLLAHHEAEVLTFLSERPIHTVAMTSLITDNGMESPLNRGKFYGYRDVNGSLEGVALIGHATLLETVSDRAMYALAKVAQRCSNVHMIMGEQERIADFWNYYATNGEQYRHECTEWLFELPSRIHHNQPATNLRMAAADELDLVMPVQAQLAFEESGVNPLLSDPEGFRQRCLRRIQQGRTWVVVENNSLVFKADVISQTAEVIYVEGIWVREDRRQTGESVEFMSAVALELHARANSICLLVNEKNKQAHRFYEKCGFLFRATYRTLFLPKKDVAN